MAPFRKIVVATDFGPSSRRAVDAGVGIAAKYDAELIIVHAVEPFVPPYPVALMPDRTLEGAAVAELGREAARVLDALPSVKTELLHGGAADQVTTFAERHAADLVVVGTHGRRGPSRWFLGSVAEKIVRASRVPVLIVRGES